MPVFFMNKIKSNQEVVHKCFGLQRSHMKYMMHILLVFELISSLARLNRDQINSQTYTKIASSHGYPSCVVNKLSLQMLWTLGYIIQILIFSLQFFLAVH